MMPVHAAISGQLHTPSIDALLLLIGREETLKRLTSVL
jgi:glutamyl/glutaminyl-tRNA synthetase